MNQIVVRIVRGPSRALVEYRSQDGELLETDYMDKFVMGSCVAIRERKRALAEEYCTEVVS